jgi:hypothetical protein
MRMVYLAQAWLRHECAVPEQAFTTLREAEAWIAKQPTHDVIPPDDIYPHELRIEWHYGVKAMTVYESAEDCG